MEIHVPTCITNDLANIYNLNHMEWGKVIICERKPFQETGDIELPAAAVHTQEHFTLPH
jgi:hypothetical protein